MKPAKSIKNIGIGIYQSFKRFPITLLFSISTAVMLIIKSELEAAGRYNLDQILLRVTMTLLLGIPLTLCIKLCFEKINLKKAVFLVLAYIISALFLALYYFFLLKDLTMVSISRYIAFSIALYLAFLYIPYLLKKEHFEMYVIKVFTGFFTTVIYSIVLFLGLAAILFASNMLLGIDFSKRIYYYTWLIVVCIFAPSYFLALVPEEKQDKTFGEYPKLLKILLLYIVIPILTAYTAILYIYFVKIIITRQWPVGIVSHLVLWYSVITAAVLFFITPLREKNIFAKGFLKWFPGIIIPTLLMMFISMGIRIKAYGITENRYWVFILGLWVLGIMIYFLFNKNLLNIVLPLSLSIVALISVFGPISSYSISKIDQNRRFEKILIKNNMIKDGRIIAAPSNIEKNDRVEISRILDYFNKNHSLKDVKYLPDNFKVSDMEKTFGFTYENPGSGSPSYSKYFFFARENSSDTLGISGYEYLFDTSKSYSEVKSDNQKINVVFSPDSSIVKIYYDGTKVYDKDFSDFANNLIKNYGLSSKNGTVPTAAMTFVDENSNIKVKFIFNNISGNINPSLEKPEIQGMDFYLLINIKY